MDLFSSSSNNDVESLLTEFISQTDDQIHMAESQIQKIKNNKDIVDPKSRALEIAEWNNKIKAMIELNRAIRSNSAENQEQE